MESAYYQIRAYYLISKEHLFINGSRGIAGRQSTSIPRNAAAILPASTDATAAYLP